jgi:hypothetical protein
MASRGVKVNLTARSYPEGWWIDRSEGLQYELASYNNGVTITVLCTGHKSLLPIAELPNTGPIPLARILNVIGQHRWDETNGHQGNPAKTEDEARWQAQLEYARKLNNDELARQASVSTNNNHRCRECFTCAALTVLEQERK